MIKFTILPDSFEKRVRKKIMINQVTASNAVVSADAWKETSDHEDETKTGAVAAIHAEQPSDIDKLAMKVKELLAGEINATDSHSHNTAFTSNEFHYFIVSNSIRYATTAPYHQLQTGRLSSWYKH
ncbi:conserved hypothetical protein [Trichinella spiralis]|uniref:hypothetical protein n=1 Tax=Trichinella spiralis TaxID=6334 RepID=UPI0001EFB307|nr:conserved hypothetical protein [Trichinella spiralis]